MIRPIQAKTILSSLKNAPDDMFGLTYNMNLYRGCQHGCIYCDSRSVCYGIENFSDILFKENALELLDKELSSKRKKGTIGTGSMNDPYMPAEREIRMSRRALEVICRRRFPVHVLTKSSLVTRDMDLLKEIGRVYSAVSVTITAADDGLAKVIEPGAPVSSERFETVRALSREGIYTGILLTPVLPFITDSPENIEEIVKIGKEAGAKYILGWMGMTLREGSRDYYYAQLDRAFPGFKEKYRRNYGNAYGCPVPDHRKLAELFKALCDKAGVATRMEFFRGEEPKQGRLEFGTGLFSP